MSEFKKNFRKNSLPRVDAFEHLQFSQDNYGRTISLSTEQIMDKVHSLSGWDDLENWEQNLLQDHVERYTFIECIQHYDKYDSPFKLLQFMLIVMKAGIDIKLLAAILYLGEDADGVSDEGIQIIVQFLIVVMAQVVENALLFLKNKLKITDFKTSITELVWTAPFCITQSFLKMECPTIQGSHLPWIKYFDIQDHTNRWVQKIAYVDFDEQHNGPSDSSLLSTLATMDIGLKLFADTIVEQGPDWLQKAPGRDIDNFDHAFLVQFVKDEVWRSECFDISAWMATVMHANRCVKQLRASTLRIRNEMQAAYAQTLINDGISGYEAKYVAAANDGLHAFLSSVSLPLVSSEKKDEIMHQSHNKRISTLKLLLHPDKHNDKSIHVRNRAELAFKIAQDFKWFAESDQTTQDCDWNIKTKN